MLQDGSPGLVTEVVTLFCENGEWIIGELTKLLYVLLLTCMQPFNLTFFSERGVV